MFTIAYLQHAGSGPLRHEEALLTAGLLERGIPVRHYTIKRVHRRQLPLGPDTFLAGDMDAVHGALRQLGVPIPEPDDYPDCLREFLHRKVWTCTLGELERAMETGSVPPTFVKPADRRKSFTGAVCWSGRDIAALGNVTRRQRIWCAEVVTWVSEYRVYVIDADVVGVDHYDGDASVPVDMGVVREALAKYRASRTAPAAYAIDFGVLADGRTALVEANDGYALGAYKIDAAAYTDLVLLRWQELLADAVR
ncbi:ATP-grasp domain-containing protein [Nocardia sp. NPDC057668]|uniref:ATP-grasp domain-containing protein n=1 Tax=Nocardia sp. NPDC057668 TaxID=3346202 RepID=UPI00366F74C5